MWYVSLRIFSLLVLYRAQVVNNVIGETTPELVPGNFKFQGNGRGSIVLNYFKIIHSDYSIEVK